MNCHCKCVYYQSNLVKDRNYSYLVCLLKAKKLTWTLNCRQEGKKNFIQLFWSWLWVLAARGRVSSLWRCWCLFLVSRWCFLVSFTSTKFCPPVHTSLGCFSFFPTTRLPAPSKWWQWSRSCFSTLRRRRMRRRWSRRCCGCGPGPAAECSPVVCGRPPCSPLCCRGVGARWSRPDRWARRWASHHARSVRQTRKTDKTAATVVASWYRNRTDPATEHRNVVARSTVQWAVMLPPTLRVSASVSSGSASASASGSCYFLLLLQRVAQTPTAKRSCFLLRMFSCSRVELLTYKGSFIAIGFSVLFMAITVQL